MAADSVRADYIQRTNAAIDYIVRNLDQKITLDDVARVACFSPFHFHRVFRSLLGETLNQFVSRLRLERALYLMSVSRRQSLTAIALKCGFSSSSDFSRSFKKRFGTAPSAFDVAQFRNSRREEFESVMSSYENGPQLRRLPAGENPDKFTVTICEFPARTVAYIRALDPFRTRSVIEAFHRLMDWAEKQGIANNPWLGYMWEDPEIVALENCRYDAAVVVDESQIDFRPEGEIGRFEFAPMQVAEVAISGDIQLEQRAFDWLFETWLPSSGCVPDDQPTFEAWNGRPFAHGYEYFELSCQLPIKRG